jgi:hypothetical protein
VDADLAQARTEEVPHLEEATTDGLEDGTDRPTENSITTKGVEALATEKSANPVTIRPDKREKNSRLTRSAKPSLN